MAQLVFDPNQGVILPTTKAIRADLATKFKRAFRTSPDDPELNTDPTSPMGQILDLLTAEIEAKNSQIAFLANMANPDTARGVFLDGLASLYFLERKVSEPTVVSCKCTGVKGTVIPYGAVVRDGNGNQYRHANPAGVKFKTTGALFTNFESIEHGPIEAPPNTVTQIVTVVAGWESVTNPVAGATGRRAETDAEFRERRFASVSLNARGSVSALEAEIRNVPGVLHGVALENVSNESVYQYGLTIDPHSVAVCVFGGADRDIARAIWAKKAAGCGTTGSHSVTYIDSAHQSAPYTYKIVRPLASRFKVKVVLYTNRVGEAEASRIKSAIVRDFLGQGNNPRVTFASTVYASRFVPIVNGVTSTPLKEVQVAMEGNSWELKAVIDATKQPTMTSADVEVVAEAG